MSKTFKSAHNNGTEVFVGGGITATNYQLVILDIGATIGKAGIYLPASEAPALALAILEAAGHGGSSESSRLMQAFDLIELHVKEQERITAEAREQAELEAEALELLNASRESNRRPTLETFDGFESTKQSWLAVARKAREMAKELTNGR